MTNSYSKLHFVQVMSKEMVLLAGKEVLDHTTQASIKTMSVPVSSEMAPAFTMVVYHFAQNDEVISDAITIPVDKITQQKVLYLVSKGWHRWGRITQCGM